MTTPSSGEPRLSRSFDGPEPHQEVLPGSTMIVSDLDRTLIYSASALQLPTPDEESPNLISVEIFQGRPQSFMTLSASRRLTDIAAAATFVPVTTRTMAQYNRVHFPGVEPIFAITSNGGNILVDGLPDQGWHRSMSAAIAACGATLSEVKLELKSRSQDDWAINRRVGDDLFCYLVVDPLLLPDDFVESWTSWCQDRGWRVSVQGRKIYAVPQPLTKERAMLAIADRIGARRVLAAGDGALDAGFLAAADAGMRPPHGELAELDHLVYSRTPERELYLARVEAEIRQRQMLPSIPQKGELNDWE